MQTVKFQESISQIGGSYTPTETRIVREFASSVDALLDEIGYWIANDEFEIRTAGAYKLANINTNGDNVFGSFSLGNPLTLSVLDHTPNKGINNSSL